MLVLDGLGKSFGGATILDNVSLTLAAGEYVAVVGESGSGKSTLLNLIAGLEHPDRGSVAMEGTLVSGLDDDQATLWRRRHVGFVFQAFHVLPYLTVAQNVALPLKLNGVAAGDVARRTAEMLQAVGLQDKAARLPRELSGGETQRIAIARALVHRPKLVLADEPTGNLDPNTAAIILDLLASEIRRNGAAGILVTHSAAAARTADATYALSHSGIARRPD